MRSPGTCALAVLAVLAALTAAPARAADEEPRTTPTRPGATTRGNFLVRNRGRFAEHQLLVAVVDVPSDRATGLVQFRSSEAHARDVAAVIAALRVEAPVPVWLVGTSMGTVSAANAAARLKEDGADGLVLTSSITRYSRRGVESVNDVRLDAIRVPTLVVHHRHDGCRFTPYDDAAGLPKRLRNAPRVELLTFAGGAAARSGPCETYAAHGYVGLDGVVVDAIARWITASAAR